MVIPVITLVPSSHMMGTSSSCRGCGEGHVVASLFTLLADVRMLKSSEMSSLQKLPDRVYVFNIIAGPVEEFSRCS